ncbi:MAG: hypothetical protein COX62_06870 [Deltaproteobacteria bacterium CG_4_10_14_0_2_um_filter_43_8]|nr:MAG: hypothetical protein COV43_05365 [Deltaproteobacteria bacterium CG11_big_fil_rev_8_21_14_0_20_42_23]PJA19356.1 MAG: hypothetical protein COX62_06870 [Deltaproteobacteria bacterium CG_4_10_14_0_2_um_filter_43_8]PJC64021.1 MAG: hypothetical protein CO021_06340 [Deltaproteobacteria bacterium CG_4_9_14_0_2_um_filter_42_21]
MSITIANKLASKAATKALEKSFQDTSNVGKQKTSFQDTLSNAGAEAKEFASKLGVSETNQAPKMQVEALNGKTVDFTPDMSVTEVKAPNGSEKLVDMLSEVNKGQMQMDSLVNHVLYSGKKFSQQELLVVQAHVFHYAQMTELTVKVAEQGVSSFKSVMNTHVGAS